MSGNDYPTIFSLACLLTLAHISLLESCKKEISPVRKHTPETVTLMTLSV